MIIDKLQVQNYHSVEDESINCCELTVLVGRNGSGKSSFLRALDLFYNPSVKVDNEDFYNRDTSRKIIISITYKNLSEEATVLFDKYLQNGTLTVQRIFSFQDGKVSNNYHGSSLQNPDFKNIRLADKAASAKSLYLTLKELDKYSALPNWSNRDEVINNLKEWEDNHPEDCIRDSDDGQFFGFKSVANGYLGRFTRFLFIPAIRDASEDAVDGNNSPITELMDLVVRSILATKPELSQLKLDVQRQFASLMHPSQLTELSLLANDMTQTLQNFVPEASIEMAWQRISEIVFPLPKADTKLNQDGYASPVNRAGHGLQRAFIITALQHLMLAQQKITGSDVRPSLPVLVLAIEEPELYQHPNSQHHLAKILIGIAKGRIPGVAEKTQVIYGTHSPHFVGIDRINQIRLLKKSIGNSGLPKITKVVENTLQSVANSLYQVTGATCDSFTEATLLPRLHSIMTKNMNEGFFADLVVLVEGEGDVSAIHGCAEVMGYDLVSMGISIIQCGGKNNIDRPALIFGGFGIPRYIIWDCDMGKQDTKVEDNHTLLRIVGEQTLCDFPDTQVRDSFACFQTNLEVVLREEIGIDIFDSLLVQAQAIFEIPEKRHALKNPSVLSHIIKTAKEQGNSSNTLESIISKIVGLRTNFSSSLS